MPKTLEIERLIEKLRVLFFNQGRLSAQEACQSLGLSQASFSRLIRKLGKNVIRVGRARNTLYLLRRTIPQLEAKIPIHIIAPSGKIKLLGNLHPFEPRGFFFESKVKEISDRIFDDLPYFLDDLRPSGFLGRLIPRQYSELNAPANILDWAASDCLRYWNSHGSSLPGNFILGDKAFQYYLNNTEQTEDIPYPKRAESILIQGEAGSSAGGEQAKFLVEANQKHLAFLVKFSPPLSEKSVVELVIF